MQTVYENDKIYNETKIFRGTKIYSKLYGNARFNKQIKVRLLHKNCEVYESNNVVKIVDTTE
ncbi:hypothetical protein GCM10023260_10640 [Bartonella acomydis]|uniref:Phage related protein n=1 Tax=Bartonella acomydis TaxID=686234 RepID=A0ABP9MQ60_9HYPH